MLEVTGDLWTYPAEFRCITTNGVVNARGELVMGKGIALEAKRRYPSLPKLLGAAVQKQGNIPVMFMDGSCNGIISFPTKHHWRNPSDLDLIAESAEALAYWSRHDWDVPPVIALPRPGCGNGGLDWERQVRPVLVDLLNDNFVVVHPQ